MNRRFLPLTGFLALAAFASHSSHAAALDRHKPVLHAQKPHGRTEAAPRHSAALKKPGHKAHDRVARKSAASPDAPQKPPPPQLSPATRQVLQSVVPPQPLLMIPHDFVHFGSVFQYNY